MGAKPSEISYLGGLTGSVQNQINTLSTQLTTVTSDLSNVLTNGSIQLNKQTWPQLTINNPDSSALCGMFMKTGSNTSGGRVYINTTNELVVSQEGNFNLGFNTNATRRLTIRNNGSVDVYGPLYANGLLNVTGELHANGGLWASNLTASNMTVGNIQVSSLGAVTLNGGFNATGSYYTYSKYLPGQYGGSVTIVGQSTISMTFSEAGSLPSGLYAVSLQTTGSLTTNVTATALAFSNGSNFSEIKGFAGEGDSIIHCVWILSDEHTNGGV
jgi:hypothetical protein